jgi:hypothetical protein
VLSCRSCEDFLRFLKRLLFDLIGTSVSVCCRRGKLNCRLILFHIISDRGVVVDSSKVDAISKWETLKLVTEIRSLLSLGGYYRKFIDGFSKLVLPLTQLICKGKAL